MIGEIIKKKKKVTYNLLEVRKTIERYVPLQKRGSGCYKATTRNYRV